jgi:fucose 4-O-acetylase-like acetyltransferase
LDSHPATSGRIDWVDHARGLAIALVVARHTVDACVYAFRMPLFFFLAGLFIVRSAEKGAGRFLGDRLRTIAYPYLVWSVLQTLLQAAAAGHTNGTARLESLAWLAVRPPMQFWFLYALFLASLWFLAAHRLGLRRAGLVVVAIAFLAVDEWVGLGPWVVLHQVAEYLPYLAIGAARGTGLARTAGRLSTTSAAGLAMGVFALLAAYNLVADPVGWRRPPAALLEIAGTVGLARVLSALPATDCLRWWGRCRYRSSWPIRRRRPACASSSTRDWA